MGKLHIESTDLHTLETLTEGNVIVKDDHVQVDLGGTAIVVDELRTKGHVVKNGVRFDVTIQISESGLEVEFS